MSSLLLGRQHRKTTPALRGSQHSSKEEFTSGMLVDELRSLRAVATDSKYHSPGFSTHA
jgi:hypothetical protein